MKKQMRVICTVLAMLVSLSPLSSCGGAKKPVKETGGKEWTGNIGSEDSSDSGNGDEAAENEHSDAKALIAAYLPSVYGGRDNKAYFTDEVPENPQESDLRIDSFVPGPEIELDGIGYSSFKITYSNYIPPLGRNSNKPLDWVPSVYPQCLMIVLEGTKEGGYIKVAGEREVSDKNITEEEYMLMAIYNLMDIRASIRIGNAEALIGPATSSKLIPLELISDTVREDLTDALYAEGDAWKDLAYDGMYISAYYNAEEDISYVQRLMSSRRDIVTYDGIRIGDSEERLREVYGACLYDEPYWDFGGEYLWYNSSPDGWGPSILFIMNNGAVESMDLINMFD